MPFAIRALLRRAAATSGVVRLCLSGLAITGAASLLSGCDAPAGASPQPSPRRPAAVTVAVHAGHRLPAGAALISPDGRVRAEIGPLGRLVIRRGDRRLWASPAGGRGARLAVTASGDVVLSRGRRAVWHSATTFPGPTVLTLDDHGSLQLRSRRGTVWSSREGNRCGHGIPSARRAIAVDLSAQHMWLCQGKTQTLTSPVTTGATVLGRATPAGTWRLEAKRRNQVLHPAGGGAYFVRYWLPYHGAYGLHDSRWQRFAYGSGRYRTRGSHGCVHVPLAAMRFVYGWAQVGTSVTIRR